MRRILYAAAASLLLGGLAAPLALADPPALSVPAKLTPVDGYAKWVPGKDVAGIVYVALDGVSPIPREVLGKDNPAFVLPTQGLKDGTYRFIAVASNDKGEQSRADFAVPVGTEVKPKPKPDPKPPAPKPPKPDPKPPAPPAPSVDAALLGKLKVAVGTDTLADPASKGYAAALAGVYSAAAKLLADPADATATAGDLYAKTFAASVLAGVPRRPALSAVRQVIETHVGAAESADPLTPAVKADFAAKYAAVGAALKEASK